MKTSVTGRHKLPSCRPANGGPSSWEGTSYSPCCRGALLSPTRIRTPLTPEILKSSMSCTMVSLLGSLGSLSRTWSKSQGATDGAKLPLTGRSRRRSPLPLWRATGRKATGLSFAGSARLTHLDRATWSLAFWGPRAPRPRNPCRPAPTWPGPGQLPGSWESVGEAPHTFQELDLIHSCLCVMPGALHHFQGHEALAPATRTLASAASPGQTHGHMVVATTKPRGRIPAGTGRWGAKGTLTGCPSTARQWRSGPSPACAPRGTVH